MSDFVEGVRSGFPKLDSRSAPILLVHGCFHGHGGGDFSTNVDTKCAFTQSGSRAVL